MINKRHFGSVKGSRFIPDDPQSFRDAFLFYDGSRVEVTVKPRTKNRSNQQNKYYWKVVVRLIGEHLGYSDNEMHEVLKHEFLRQDGKVISTTDLTTQEFEEYMENVKRWAVSEFQVYIPDPNMVVL